jgi:starch synthase
MPQTISVLFLAAEAEPFVKVGGLGDVAGALPQALRALSNEEVKIDVRLVLPMHSVVHAETRPLAVYSLPRGDSQVPVEAHTTTLDGMPVYFINGDPIRNSGSVYSADNKLDGEKYTFFALAALELPRQIGWDVDVVHCNDWHTALAAYGNLVRRWDEGSRKVSSVLSIHNLPFMGPDVSEIIESYKLPHAQTDLPDWARVMPMPLGLWSADAMVAVSPSYADEILTPDFGCGLQDFLLNRKDHLHGILNGLDVKSYNPEDDNALGFNFSIETLLQRIKNKKVLQERLRLPTNDHIPLLAMVSRMDPQKGIDIALKSLKMLAKENFQAVILGTGDPKLEEEALKLQEAFPEKIKVETRFDAGLARQIYAGADMFIMPSRYEPCGISQMIAMRYGCVPVVRAVGGLKDTVTHKESGFVFQKPHHLSLNYALKTALSLYPNREAWEKLQHNGMLKDFAWQISAKKYLELYQTLIANG